MRSGAPGRERRLCKYTVDLVDCLRCHLRRVHPKYGTRVYLHGFHLYRGPLDPRPPDAGPQERNEARAFCPNETRKSTAEANARSKRSPNGNRSGERTTNRKHSVHGTYYKRSAVLKLRAVNMQKKHNNNRYLTRPLLRI